jgi:general secretion pathway protein D
VNKLPALLLAGLLGFSPVYAQETAAPPADQQEPPKITRSGDDFITLNFNNIDIAALIKVMSEFTRRNFILDDKVAGKVTLMTPTKVSPDEAYQIFLSALEIKGFTAIEDGKIIRIIPTSTARQSGLKVIQDGGMEGEGFVTKLIRTSYVDPQDLVRTLTPLISRDGMLLAYPATNSLIITDSVMSIKKIEKLVEAMDVAVPTGKGRINVYPLKNAGAEDIAKVMQSLVSRMPAPPPQGGAKAAQAAASATILEGSVNITADKATNSLIIIASPADFETMKDVIQKLDIPRRQVYVEAAIIEMGLSKANELGFEFMYAPQEIRSGPGAPTTPFGGTNFGGIVPATVSGPAAFANFSGMAVGAVKGTFTYRGQEYLNIGALLRALQTDVDVNVLSTPNILTSDNQKAEIMVGQNVPITTGQTQNAVTGSTSIFNTIQREDVGIKLAITPQISSDDNVRLEINQEISDVVDASATNAAGLITNKRTANTTVVVKDRETMVIGGLIRDNVTSAESKVPLLGDIPLIGWLFKYRTTKVEKTNLMIFITPYIIKNEQEAAAITQKKGEVLENFRTEHRMEKKEGEAPIKLKKPEAGPAADPGVETGQAAPPASEPVTGTPPPAMQAAPAESPVSAPATTAEGAR